MDKDKGQGQSWLQNGIMEPLNNEDCYLLIIYKEVQMEWT